MTKEEFRKYVESLIDENYELKLKELTVIKKSLEVYKLIRESELENADAELPVDLYSNKKQ